MGKKHKHDHKTAAVTLQTIADAMGVSRATVSNAFNRPDQLTPELREKILHKAKELKYGGPDAAAAVLRKGRTDTIGVIFTESLAYALTDPVALAMVLTEFAKESPVLQFKAGVVEGRPIAANQVGEIAALPSREQLIAKLLYLLQSPVTRLVRVLAAAGPQRLATVLDQVAKNKS